MAGGTAHILVVEDNAAVRLGLVHGLEDLDAIRITGCATAEEAEGIIRRDPADLLVTDLRLPGKWGLSLLEVLADRGEAIPVIVITGYRAEYQDRIPTSERITILEKPFSLADLREVVLERLESGAQGEAEGRFLVTDYLQLAALGQHTVLIEAELADGRLVVAEVVDGDVWNVRSGNQEGTPALAGVLHAPAKAVTVKPMARRPARRRIKEPIEHVLLELARVQDERGAAPQAGSGEAPSPGSASAGRDDEFQRAFSTGIDASLAGRYDEALAAFARAVELRPDHAGARHNLGQIRRRLGLES